MKEKLRLLESYQARVESYFATLRREYPNDSIWDMHIAFTVLITPIVVHQKTQETLKDYISAVLDFEAKNGLLPEREEQKDSGSLP